MPSFVQDTAFKNTMRMALAFMILGFVLMPHPQPADARDQPQLVRVEVVQEPSNALITIVHIQTERPTLAWVEYGHPGEDPLRTALSGPLSDHRIPIVRLRALTTYNYQVFISADPAESPNEPAWTGSFRTGPLPNELSAFTFEAIGTSSMPLTLMEFGEPRGPDHAGALIVDAAGNMVWYYSYSMEGFNLFTKIHGLNSGRSQPWKQLHSGNFMALVLGVGLVEITPDQQIVACFPTADRAHHDFLVTENGMIRYLAHSYRVLDLSEVGLDERQVLGFTIREIDPSTREDRVIWDSFDHLPPKDYQWVLETDSGYSDYLHANSLWIGQNGNTLVSLRRSSEVLSISPDMQEIQWVLGGGQSSLAFMNASGDPSPEAQFYSQHTAVETQPGRVLLFDNGTDRPYDRVNSITNPSIESDTSGWSTGLGNTISQSTEQAKVGEYSLKSVYGGSSDKRVTTFVLTLEPTTYSQKIWVYIPSEYTGSSVAIIVSGFGGDVAWDPNLPSRWANMALRDQWQRLELTWMPAEADLTGNAFDIRMTGVSAGDYIYVDDAQVTLSPFSRVVEYALDFEAGTATLIDEFQGVPPLYSAAVSSSTRLANGNTLGGFTFADPPTVIEFDTEGREIWRLQRRNEWSNYLTEPYRAVPLVNIAGETIAP